MLKMNMAKLMLGLQTYNVQCPTKVDKNNVPNVLVAMREMLIGEWEMTEIDDLYL